MKKHEQTVIDINSFTFHAVEVFVLLKNLTYLYLYGKPSCYHG